VIALRTHHLRADLLMLLCALIWGCSFVAQRLSLATIGPFLFTAVRFLLGALVISLISLWLKPTATRSRPPGYPWRAGAVLGALVAVSILAQQVGMRYTKVANAGFISSMYVVIVPLLSVFMGQRVRLGTALGAACAAVGLYYLSGEHWKLSYGDGLELFGAAVISAQLLLISAYIQKHDPLRLAIVQCLVCGLLCLGAASVVETIRLQDLQRSVYTLLYGGAVSVGIGYAIQMLAQREALTSHAAIIFSMEGVFAALAAWILIGETLSWHAIGGCALVAAGCLFSQLMPARG
jgi:drug/metabolite transporter (DMT)-like permease